jgi:hypothetical protein
VAVEKDQHFAARGSRPEIFGSWAAPTAGVPDDFQFGELQAELVHRIVGRCVIGDQQLAVEIAAGLQA